MAINILPKFCNSLTLNETNQTAKQQTVELNGMKTDLRVILRKFSDLY